MRFRILLMILLSCFPALAQTADSKNKGVISGRVIGEEGQPLAGASIQAQSRAGVARLAISSEDGSFRLTGLSSTNYTLSAYLPAYVMLPLVGPAGEPQVFRDGDSATLTLVRGGVITGRITDSNDEPIPGLNVHSVRLKTAEGKFVNGIGYTRRTDDRGVYRIFGLPAGTYIVKTDGADAGWSWNADEQVNDGPIYYPSSSRDTATELTVQPGTELSGIDIRYRAERGHTVSGKLSAAIANSGAMVFLRLPNSIESVSSDFRFVREAKPGEGVGFELRGVADGEYDLVAEQLSGNDDGAASLPRRVTVRGAEISGIELRLVPLASITGKVKLEEVKDAACLKLRAGTIAETVIAVSGEQPPASLTQPLRFASGYSGASGEGDFKITKLFAARYRFSFQLPSEAWYVRSIAQPDSQSQQKLSLADGLTIKSGEKVKDVTVTLATGAAKFSGKLKTDTGKQPSANLLVHLIPVEKESAEDPLRYFEARAAENRSFTFKNLPPGKYWLLTRPEEKVVSESANRSKLRREAEANNILIELKPCQQISNHEIAIR